MEKEKNLQIDALDIFNARLEEELKESTYSNGYNPKRHLEILDKWVETDYKLNRKQYKPRLANSRLFSISYLDCGKFPVKEKLELINKILASWSTIFRHKGFYQTAESQGQSQDFLNRDLASLYGKSRIRNQDGFNYLISIENSLDEENFDIHCFIETDVSYQWSDFFKFDLIHNNTKIRTYTRPIKNKTNERLDYWFFMFKKKNLAFPDRLVNPLDKEKMIEHGVFTNMTKTSQSISLEEHEDINFNLIKKLAQGMLIDKMNKAEFVSTNLIKEVIKSIMNRYPTLYAEDSNASALSKHLFEVFNVEEVIIQQKKFQRGLYETSSLTSANVKAIEYAIRKKNDIMINNNNTKEIIEIVSKIAIINNLQFEYETDLAILLKKLSKIKNDKDYIAALVNNDPVVIAEFISMIKSKVLKILICNSELDNKYELMAKTTHIGSKFTPSIFGDIDD